MKNLILALMMATIPSTVFSQTAQTKEVKTPAKPVYEDYPLNLSKIGLTLPDTADPELKRLFTSSRTIFYKLPQVWQHYVPASRIEYKNVTLNTTSRFSTEPIYGLFFATYAPDFHANGNFPWETTIGLNSAHKEKDNPYRTINLINLPDDKPILILNGYPIKWIYPAGTTVGEVIYVIHKGQRYIQEIRTRTKSKDCVDWEPGLYRPIKDREEFIALTGLNNYTPAFKHFYFRNPQEDEVFEMKGLVERLPALDETKVKKLLNRPFKAVHLDATTWSPAADQDFHLLPKNYCFSLLGGIDSTTCANCHRQTQISVRNLVPKDPDVINYPKKIGNIRGDDAVFTWHPFNLNSVRHSAVE